jgi:hypothetical protein
MQNQLNFNWSPYYEDIFIGGKKGEGKTTRAKKILDLIPNIPRWIWSPQRPLENFEGYGEPVTSISEMKHGAYLFAGDYTKANFEEFCIRSFSYMRNIVNVIDDCHEQQTKQFIPPYFENLILSGRNRGISSIFISPTPAKVHNTILGQCSHYFAYKFTLVNQIEWLRDNVFGNEAWLLLSKDLRNKKYVSASDPDQLPKYSYLYRKDTDFKTQIMTPEGILSTKTPEIETEETLSNESPEIIDSDTSNNPETDPQES